MTSKTWITKIASPGNEDGTIAVRAYPADAQCHAFIHMRIGSNPSIEAYFDAASVRDLAASLMEAAHHAEPVKATAADIGLKAACVSSEPLKQEQAR